MKNIFIVGHRVFKQLLKDKKLFALSVIAPLIIIYLFKLFTDAMPGGFPVARYAIPIAAFIVHFLSFLLCGMSVVQERTAGTLQRMFVAGFRRHTIIGGYVVGYFGLATLQAIIVLGETIWLMDLSYDFNIIVAFFITIWILAVVSVMFGIFVSTFARNESHIAPFIPLFILPSFFLSGLLIDIDKLPAWAEIIGGLLPFRYANNIIQELISSGFNLGNVYQDFLILLVYIFGLLLIASKTLREKE